MATKQRSSRKFGITTTDSGDILDMGPAGTESLVSTFVLQFITSGDFAGSFAVLGRVFGQAAKDANAAFATVPYRRVNVNGVSSDYAIVSDLITGPGIIQVPMNGMALGLQVTCTAGSCQVVSWDLQGSSAI